MLMRRKLLTEVSTSLEEFSRISTRQDRNKQEIHRVTNPRFVTVLSGSDGFRHKVASKAD